ncbi:DUF4333 domain-containing protein [Phormidium sp. CLA17]|uniref:DUF4333 domain-containing protein n=1 Tax=Leptolyngbya sp. Cla-17 TaxID=2803751 RepID=UPI001491DC8F|nr:DUF4333 domain-containing protein [Leptolyngbya sp. Cla-17]MBM0743906.1 DUF4333 domain-containing protein [Leptolyngbya sp. Cla-17]
MNYLWIAQLSIAGLLLGGLVGCTESRSPTGTAPTVPPSSTVAANPSVMPSAAAIRSTIPKGIAQKPAATKALEYRLKTEVSKKSGIPVQSITCPISANPEDGKPFDCRAIAANQTFLVALRPKETPLAPTAQAGTKPKLAISPDPQPQFPNPAQKSELQWSTKGLLVLPKLEKTIQKDIKAQFQIEVKTNCGGKIRVVKPGDTFACQVTDQKGTTKPITVRVDDEKGNVTWKF